MSTTTPSMADVLSFYIDDDRASLYVALPARVEKYNAAAQTVDCLPTTKRISRDADGTRLVDPLPVVPAVPVAWPRGGGFFVALPLAVGDGGLIVCCDSDLGAWRDTGQVSDPGDERRHGLAGAVFIPGLETVSRALTSAPTDRLRLGKDAGGPIIEIDGSFVHLGAAGGQFVALANLVMARLNAIQTAFDAHTHLYSPGPGGPAPTAPPPTPIGTLADVAATLTKAT